MLVPNGCTVSQPHPYGQGSGGGSDRVWDENCADGAELSVMRRAFLAAAILGMALSSAGLQSTSDAVSKSNGADALLQSGKPEQAIPIYRALAVAFPAELSFRVNLAIALYKAGRYRQTIEECTVLTKRQPDLLPAWLFLAASHLKLGAALAAEEPLRKALTIQPNDPNAHVMLADVMLATAHWTEAADQYEITEQLMPDSPRVLFGLDRSYEALADESLKRLEAVAPGSAEHLALSAELEFDRGQVAPAFQHCRQALALQPSFREVHALVSSIYETTGHTDWAAVESAKAVRDSETCAAPSPECEFLAGRLREIASAKAESPNTIYWQARAFLDLSRQAFGRLQELPPSRERYEAAAVAEEKRGKYPEAAAAWKKALQFEPSNAPLRRQLALALCHSNDCVSALPLLKEQLSREPSSAEMNYLYGLALTSTRNPAEALPYLETAVRLNGTFLPARAALGEAYLEAGRPQPAIPHLKASIVEDETGSRHYQLAQAYQAAGMRVESSAVLREYREIISRRRAEQPGEPNITPP